MKLVLLLAATLGATLGCTSGERPPCTPAALTALEGQYIAEATSTCRGHSFDDCPELPAIRAKYRAKRDEWKDCR